MDRLDIVNKLKQGVWSVKFTKVDGTERIMPCTLDPAILPAQNITEDRAVRKTNMETLRVYVTDIAQWRSFRIENVISVELAQ